MRIARRHQPLTREFRANTVDQVAGGDRHLLASLEVTRGGCGRGRRLHAADFTPRLVALALHHRRLDAQQVLLERLLLRGTGTDARQHSIGVGRASRGQPGTGRAQAEFHAVVAGGFARQALVEGGGAGMIAGTRSRIGPIHRRGGRRAGWTDIRRAAAPSQLPQ